MNKARSAADSDALTGVASRAAFMSMLADAYGRATEAEGTLTVATLDVDGLHDPAHADCDDSRDAILTAFARRLEDAYETYGGEIGRIGPETFAVLLPGVDARSVAQASKALAESGVSVSDDATLAIRAGFTTLDPESSSSFPAPAALLTAAEQALDAARSAGGAAVRAFVPQSRNAA